MRHLSITLAVTVTLASAQERPTPPDRRDLAPPRDTVASALPTFDLPEFVITGLSSIELPRVEKRLEEGGPTGNVLVATAAPVRDRTTGLAPGADLGNRPSVGLPTGFEGYVRAGMGSYRMPQVLVAVRPIVGSLSLGVSGQYRRSSGFAPWTSWSEGGGKLSAALPVDLGSAGVTNATLSGDLAVDSRSYHWYGTSSPWHRRKMTLADGGIGARGLLGAWNGSLSLRFGSTSFADTSASVTESTTRVDAGVEGTVQGIPLAGSISVLSSERSLAATSPAGVASLKVESRWQPMPSVWLSGGIGFAFLQGDGGQRRGVLLPTVLVRFAIDEQHRLAGAFEPRVEGITLMSSQGGHRFVDAQTPLRQSYWSNAGRFGLESDWTPDIRTRVEVEAGKASDLAMVADPSVDGVMQWLYGDASFAALRAECIAKMRGNDYFSATVILRSSRNAASGLRIPYWPGLEARVSYMALVTPSLTVRSSLQIVHTRETQWLGASSALPEYIVVDVVGSYAVLPSLSVWSEVTNLSNSVYQHWKGIQEPPFRLSAGIALAW
ncbi:MAG: hypothetical protein MUE68_02920 [Bacteroidetes bacterium]|jgi:hypothetical protein|nr:hypothetical protein [Bacteroidota bacterium]